MKKLIIGAAVFAAAFGLKAELASANIVGFNTVDTGSSPYITGGMCFVTPGGEGTFKLNDISLSGAAYASDWINFINPATCIVDPAQNVTYYSKAESIADGGDGSDAGWYDISDAYKGDVTYPKGTAFLANFLSQNVTVTFSGEVVRGDGTVDCTGKPYAYVANLYPANIELNEISLEGAAYASDWINFIDPATCIVDPTLNVTYYSKAESIADGGDGSDAGWYDIADADQGSRVIPAGSGFLCNFLSTGVKVVFPVVE